jgi:integrase
VATTKVGVFHDARKRQPWVVRWYGEYDPANGKQRRYSKGFRLKRDAEGFRAAKQAELDKGGQRDSPTAISLGTFCKKYERQRRHEWAESTRGHVEDVCGRLLTFFGEDAPLSTITGDRAAAFWAGARKIRRQFEGDELSKSTRNWLLRYAKTMFNYAVEWGHLAVNPFAGIRSIRVGKRNRRRWHFVKPAEYRALLCAAPTLRWKVFYALAYTSAARFGELFNLTEENIDFDRRMLLIAGRQGTAELPAFHIKDHEDRQIPLPRSTLKLVAELLMTKSSSSPFLLLTPERYALVLHRWRECRASGKPWLNTYMTNNTVRDIRQHAKKAGLKFQKTLTVHSLRKSCGQNWANHLPMNVVKEFMGHADIGTTAEFYGTVTDDHAAHASRVIEAIATGHSIQTTDARLTPESRIRPNRRVG